MSRAVRILVANQPKLLRELILATLTDQPGIEIVGEASNDSEIVECVHRTLPDFLVVDLDQSGERPFICETVLREHPELRIIAVSSEENRSVCYRASLVIESDEIEPSEEGILRLLRSAPTEPRHS